METIRRHVVVSGRVQGVWFRQSTADTARRAGLAGWVRNLPDGRVEAVFEGPAPSVEFVVEWCREGPPAARVEAVEVAVEDPAGEAGFAVRS